MKIKSIFIAYLLIFGLTMSVGSSANEPNLNEDNVAKAIEAAETARKKAASIDGEWRDTAKFIEQAREALELGELETAMKLAKKAEHEGHMGYEQAYSQRKMVFPSYLTR